ncbi:MAG: BrnT family toxin [Chloroflexi bacterium]|nr:BrnT family toxin [Chloroflexota bacterium]
MFEYDLAKSSANLKKHGIDFEQAQQLWDDSNLIEIPARTVDEPRFLVIGKISGKHWAGIITYRSDNIRIISVRRARKEEINLYESF